MKLDGAVGGGHTLARPVINITTWQTFQVVIGERIINSEERTKFVGMGSGIFGS
jgi:hypothetical protein